MIQIDYYDCRIYVSNESPKNLFFDNLQEVYTKGPILGETHYYRFGLTMAGISSKALKSNYYESRRKYNGMEYDADLDIGTYEALYRNLDAQTGRWWQVDPKTDS